MMSKSKLNHNFNSENSIPQKKGRKLTSNRTDDTLNETIQALWLRYIFELKIEFL